MEMRLDHGLKCVEITLSRTNLVSMIHKIDEMGDSACAIMRQVGDGWTLLFRGEDDETHYANRTRGRMHPLTERYLRAAND